MSNDPVSAVGQGKGIDPADLHDSSPVRLATYPEVLTGPEPAESARGQQAVDEAIEDFLQGHSPRLALPDAVAQMSHAVGEERRSACYAEDGEIRRAGRDRATGEIGDEETDDEAISKPHPEEFGHGGRTAGKHGQRACGSLLEFFYRGGRLHFFGEAIRERSEERRVGKECRSRW